MNNKFDFDKHFPFKEERVGQRDACEQIINHIINGKKIIILDAPTGSGKSAIAYTIASYMNDSYFLTSQKILQKQYEDSFRKFKNGINSIKGKANYNCIKDSRLQCDMGLCTFTKQNRCGNCPYYVARDKAYSSKNCLLNYKYFLNMANLFNSPQEKRHLLICDEAHHLEDELYDYLTVSIKMPDFGKHKVKAPLIPSFKNKDQAYEWLNDVCLLYLKNRHSIEQSSLEMLDNKDADRPKLSKKVLFLDSLICMIDRFNTEVDHHCGFVINQDNYGITFKPLLIKSKRFTDHFFRFADVKLLMSATILDYDIFCRYLGIDKKDVGIVTVPNQFPEKNNTLYFWNTGSMSMKNRKSTLGDALEIIDLIIEHNSDSRGIIHTVSNINANELMENLKYNHRLHLATGKNREETVKYFQNHSEKDAIIISPSLSEGISLDGAMADFSIIMKVPFLNLGDEWNRERLRIDQQWYALNTVRAIVQMAGRHQRSKDDICSTHIIDSDFGRLYRQNKKFFPKEWQHKLDNQIK
jgi:Rad3-related DNA helicase